MNHRVVFLLYPGVAPFDVAGPAQAFSAADDAYRLHFVSVSGGSIDSDCGGLTLGSTTVDELRDPIDTLVLPGGLGVFAARHDAALVACAQHLAARAKRIATVCVGAFLAAEAGLLNGRRVTTHWRACEAMRASYPDVRLEPMEQHYTFADRTGHYGLFSCHARSGAPLWHVAVTSALRAVQGLHEPVRAIDTLPMEMLSIRAVDASAVREMGDALAFEERSLANEQAGLHAHAKDVADRRRALLASLTVGTNTNCGLVISIRGPLAEVQVPANVTLPNGSTRLFIPIERLDVPGGESCIYN